METKPLDVEKAVSERYSAGARVVEKTLCCPVDYDPKLLAAIPKEIQVFLRILCNTPRTRVISTCSDPTPKKKSVPAGTLLEKREKNREGGYFTTRVPFFDQCLKDQNFVQRKLNTPFSVATSSTVTDSFFRKCFLMPNSFILTA